MLKKLMFVQTPSALLLLASQALSTSRFSSTEGAGAVALFYSRTSKAQSLDQGYPRKSVAEVRADSPPPRLQLAGVLQHLPAVPKIPLEISWPLQKDFKARNPKPSTPALSRAKRQRLGRC